MKTSDGTAGRKMLVNNNAVQRDSDASRVAEKDDRIPDKRAANGWGKRQEPTPFPINSFFGSACREAKNPIDLTSQPHGALN